MFQSLKKFIIPAVMLTAAVAFAAPAAQAELTRDEVKVMIKDYIMENPQLILDSVNEFQRRSQTERQTQALAANKDELFNNEKSPVLGNPKGDVTIVEFFDYNCHYCKEVFTTLYELTQEDKNLRVVFKDYPILGPVSELAAKWALAAQQQDKYFEFHKKLMEHKGPLKNEDIDAAARDIGLDVDRGRMFVDGTDSLLQIERNRGLAAQMSFNGTPSFVVNDEAFSGVPTKDDLKKKVADKRSALKAGTAVKEDEKKEDKKDEKKE